jgi:hypothetical protein
MHFSVGARPVRDRSAHPWRIPAAATGITSRSGASSKHSLSEQLNRVLLLASSFDPSRKWAVFHVIGLYAVPPPFATDFTGADR